MSEEEKSCSGTGITKSRYNPLLSKRAALVYQTSSRLFAWVGRRGKGKKKKEREKGKEKKKKEKKRRGKKRKEWKRKKKPVSLAGSTAVEEDLLVLAEDDSYRHRCSSSFLRSKSSVSPPWTYRKKGLSAIEYG